MRFVIADIVNKNFNPYSLEESKILIKNLNGKLEKVFLQNRNYPSSASYIGTGKAKEIAQFCLEHKIDVFLINGMLKPSVYNTLRDYFSRDTQIWDKIDLILAIFDHHAQTKEAKLQIEYAKIKYQLPRLKGWGKQLSSLGAGIGTRGPGEKIMEKRRRHYEKRLNHIQKQLNQWQKVLQSQRKGRKTMKKALLLGYSNVGKSTLFNALTGKNVLTKDILFATLDNRIAKLKTTYPIDLLVIDTIGFIHGVPPLVLNSFLPILEEIKLADILILVLDISLLSKDPAYFQLQFETILDVLQRFQKDIQDKRLILAFNKVDLLNGYFENEKLLIYADKLLDFVDKVDIWKGSAYQKQDIKQLKETLLDF